MLLHARFSIVGLIPFLLAAIFFHVIPIVGLCLWAGSYDKTGSLWELILLLFKQRTIGVHHIIKGYTTQVCAVHNYILPDTFVTQK